MSDLLSKRGVARPIVEIPTGVDTVFFSTGQREPTRRALGLSESDFLLGHLGRLAPEKNLEYLAASAADYMQRDERAWFFVAGSGPSEDVIKRILTNRGVRHRLILAGQQVGRDLADAYTAMDLFIFASHSETQGMVLTEAMAAGKPVIALDAPGAREVVRDGYNGRLLAAEASIHDFAAATAEMAQNEYLVRKYGRAARETAKEFSRKICSNKLKDLYHSIREEYAPHGRAESMDYQPWVSILERLKAEWDLAVGKTTAVVEAFTSDDEEFSLE